MHLHEILWVEVLPKLASCDDFHALLERAAENSPDTAGAAAGPAGTSSSARNPKSGAAKAGTPASSSASSPILSATEFSGEEPPLSAKKMFDHLEEILQNLHPTSKRYSELPQRRIPLHVRLPKQFSPSPARFGVQWQSPEFQLWLLLQIAVFLDSLERDNRRTGPQASSSEQKSIHKLPFKGTTSSGAGGTAGGGSSGDRSSAGAGAGPTALSKARQLRVSQRVLEIKNLVFAKMALIDFQFARSVHLSFASEIMWCDWKRMVLMDPLPVGYDLGGRAVLSVSS